MSLLEIVIVCIRSLELQMEPVINDKINGIPVVIFQ